MPEVICDTSPIQYLHQLDLLHILPALADRVIAPPAVIDEISAGRSAGVDLPDPASLMWLGVRRPAGTAALPLTTDLGRGETEVLLPALESRGTVVILDDAVARRAAESLGLRLTGTLGLLIDARRAGLVAAVGPLLDQLQTLGFRVAPGTRAAVLELAGELPGR